MTARKIQYHEEVRQQKMLSILRTIVFLSLFLCFCIVAIFIFFFSPLFRISHITILGEKYVQGSQIEKSVSYLIHQPILLAQVNVPSLKSTYPLIESVSVDKTFPSNITLQIHEYPPVVLFQTQSLTYVASTNGQIIDRVVNTSNKYNLPLVVSEENNPEAIPMKEIAAFVLQLENDKSEFITNFIFFPPYELDVRTASGRRIRMSLNKDSGVQISEIDGIKKYLGESKCLLLDIRFDTVFCSDASS